MDSGRTAPGCSAAGSPDTPDSPDTTSAVAASSRNLAWECALVAKPGAGQNVLVFQREQACAFGGNSTSKLVQSFLACIRLARHFVDCSRFPS